MSYNATENSASRRIATLLDEGSFVEIGGAVTARSTTFNLQEKAAPSDGVITGYGVIDGNLVYVYSQDADVLGGALGEMHAKKIARIYDYYQQQQDQQVESERKSKVGTGDRAEKIRTYNYPQNRVTDHRIGLTIQQLDRIIEGKLDDIITALINEDQRLKLEGQN